MERELLWKSIVYGGEAIMLRSPNRVKDSHFLYIILLLALLVLKTFVLIFLFIDFIDQTVDKTMLCKVLVF